MLEPQDRRLLLDSLRPPLGYRLDQAVGTTFTLDLVALLTAPLAFTLFDIEQDDGGRPSADPLALLKATRDHADAITVFCQAGHIGVPPENQLLYSQLEDVVVETTAPGGGVFHPKVWVLRYVTSGGPVRYRLLCLSRNLTFDRSWDICLRLDGELRRRKNAYASNHPLGDFIAALPGLALRSIARTRKEAIAQIAEEVRRVEFDFPEGFEELGFHPIGIPRYQGSPFTGDMRRIMVVSPFVDRAGLGSVLRVSDGADHILVSRTESLAKLGGADELDDFELKVLDEAAEAELEAAARADEEETNLEQTLDGVLCGLHAKLFVTDAGSDARVWLGSANATEAALKRNVEFLVELAGRNSSCGVEALLHGPATGVPGFGDLLVDYETEEEGETDDVAEELSREAERLQSFLAELRMVARADGPDSEGRYALLLSRAGRTRADLPQGASLRTWLITQAPAHARQLDLRETDEMARLEGLEIEQLTTFVAFELELQRDGRKHRSRFVLNLPLLGAPRGRHEEVLRSLLREKDGLRQYLLFVLAEAEGVESLSSEALAGFAGRDGKTGPNHATLQPPLLEPLVRTLARDPQKLSQIARLLDDIGDDEEIEQLLPGFREIWDPVWAARGRR